MGADGTLSDGPATLRIICPLWGATLNVQAQSGAAIDHTLRAYGWDGSQLASSTGALTLPTLTWEVEVEVGTPPTTPALTVQDAGTPQGVLDGGDPTDCTRVSDPNWPQITLTNTT